MLHFDVPWNPSRLEQRNGRLDRHGQARDVTIWHFVSTEDQDLAFMAMIVRKVDSIREDLGATGEVFDEITHRRLIEGEDLKSVQRDLDLRVENARRKADVPRDNRVKASGDITDADPAGDLSAIASELDLEPEAIRKTLDSAMALAASRPRITDPDDEGRCEIIQPHPSSWASVIDDAVRIPSSNGGLGAVPRLAFDPETFVFYTNGRPVFRSRSDTLLMHLAHPMLQRALSSLTRRRFPGGIDLTASLWTAYEGDVPDGVDALVCLTAEELAVNELRESFHHWVKTWRFPVSNGRLGDPLPHIPASDMDLGTELREGIEDAKDIWLDVGEDVRGFIQSASRGLTETLGAQLGKDLGKALEDENSRYQSRQGEVSVLIEGSTMAKLEREIEELRVGRQQGQLFSQQEAFEEMDRDITRKEEELDRRTRQYEEVRQQLAIERERIVGNLLPKRYAMRGEAQVLPVAIEIVLPGAGR